MPTEENSAYMATRGKPPDELSSMWWNGPSWLSQPMQLWPNSKTPELDTKLQEQFEFELKGRATVLEPDLVAGESSLNLHGTTLKDINENKYLIQNSQAVKKVCGPQKGYGEKRCEIQGGGQEMAVMVG